MLPQETIERLRQDAQDCGDKYGHIYAVRIGDRVKIGFSKRDPKGRIAQHESLCRKLGNKRQKNTGSLSLNAIMVLVSMKPTFCVSVV